MNVQHLKLILGKVSIYLEQHCECECIFMSMLVFFGTSCLIPSLLPKPHYSSLLLGFRSSFCVCCNVYTVVLSRFLTLNDTKKNCHSRSSTVTCILY